jgi:S-adenosyl-L-methionine hydrolase (adenosine-forming)
MTRIEPARWRAAEKNRANARFFCARRIPLTEHPTGVRALTGKKILGVKPMGPRIERVAIVTDFGPGLYVGQMRARLSALQPGLTQIDLVQDLPPFRPDLAAYLLPALMRDMPPRTLYLCVVDPGVGGDRAVLLVRAGVDWLIGPDNGLLARVVAGAPNCGVWRIGWQPERMSASFHGRDWMAPAAARLIDGADLILTEIDPMSLVGADWPGELGRVLYVDRYGNLITGMRMPEGAAQDYRLRVGTSDIRWARIFCEMSRGQPFWYEDAFGLIEIAVSQGRADLTLGLRVGDPVGPLVAC